MNRNDSDEQTRSVVLLAIRDRVNDITSGECDRPVFLKEVTVSDPGNAGYAGIEFFSLNSLFYRSDGKLCGDLMPLRRTGRGGSLVFGRDIEDLGVDDLENVLRNLNRNNWFIMDFEDNLSLEGSGNGLVGFLKNRFRRAAS